MLLVNILDHSLLNEFCGHYGSNLSNWMIKVSQRLMVQGYSSHANYNGGFDVACKILKSEGIRGLYRGFGLSAITYAPSGAVWWGSYGSSQRFIWR